MCHRNSIVQHTPYVDPGGDSDVKQEQEQQQQQQHGGGDSRRYTNTER